MKQITNLICALILCTSVLPAQTFNKSLNKDSVLQSLLKDIPEEKREQFLEQYRTGSDQTKEFLLFVLSMPRSSKKELIRNIDSNYDKIDHLKTEYAKLVPDNYTIMIEFEPEDNLVNTKESIDLRITFDDHKESKVYQDWNLPFNSDKLDKMLAIVGWSNKTLTIIKKLLTDAHCVSIENGEIGEIGFSRSGMGKYFYMLFDKDLTSKELKYYNNGCNYIYYKDRIVLEYGIGAVGSPCFPD
jgi:hypothetical protein